MAIPLKIYYGPSYNGVDPYMFITAPAYNTPSGYSEASLDFVKQNASADQQRRLVQAANNEQGANVSTLDQIIGAPSQYITGPNGAMTTQSALDSMNPLNHPNETNIGTAQAPLWVPKGSAGDALASGLSTGAVSPTNPTQQMTASLGGDLSKTPGVVPSFPNITPTAPVPGVSPTTPITSSSMNPTSPLNPVSPIYPPVQNVSTLGTYNTPPLVQTPQEAQAQTLSGNIQSLNDQLAGKAAYQSSQEVAAGIPELQKTQNDLTAQLNQLKAEAASIPIDLQNQAAGRGITTTILGRQQEKLLQENAVKALGISAMLSASQGNLALAQDQADRAVKAKYGPIEAEIAAKKANLDLIINSPDYTVAEKNRAMQQQAIQNANQVAVTTAKQNTSDIYSIAVKAANDGAPALTLQQIQNAPDPSTALQIYSGFIASKAVPTNKNVSGTGNTGGNITPAGVNAPVTTLNGKPMTDTQATAYGFAQRLNDANQVIDRIGANFTGVSSYITGSTFFPNILKSSDRQQFEQAERNFVNAILRKESGAAISPSEFDSAAKQYFPQPGDGAGVIAQKATNRQRAIQNLSLSANVPSSAITGSQSTGGSSYQDYLKAIGQ